ncbi:MAG: hypothetical protein WC506_05005 [Candidatus Micrarchaeia archaeon]
MADTYFNPNPNACKSQGGNGNRIIARSTGNSGCRLTPLDEFEKFKNGQRNGGIASSLMHASGSFRSSMWKEELEMMRGKMATPGQMQSLLEEGYKRFVQRYPNMALRLTRECVMTNPMATKAFMLVYAGSKPASIINIGNFDMDVKKNLIPFKIYPTQTNGLLFYAYDGEQSLIIAKYDMLVNKILGEKARAAANGMAKAKIDFDREIGNSLGFPADAIKKFTKGNLTVEAYYSALATNDIEVRPESFLPIFVPQIKNCAMENLDVLKSWDNEFARMMPPELFAAYRFASKLEVLEGIERKAKLYSI